MHHKKQNPEADQSPKATLIPPKILSTKGKTQKHINLKNQTLQMSQTFVPKLLHHPTFPSTTPKPN